MFLGTPEFAAIVLERMIKADYAPNIIITAPDKLIGRKQILTSSPVKARILNYQLRTRSEIKILQPENIRNLKLEIKNLQPDLIILAAYGQIIPQEILDIPKYGCLNIHPSLLPKYRGASPVQTAILNGDQETGVTIMLMDKLLDHGNILANSKFEIQNSKITTKELTQKLAKLGAELLIKTIPDWIKGKIKAQPQDHSQASFTKIIKKEDGQIDWQNSADYIERMTRAYQSWPGTYAEFKTKNQEYKKLKIIKVSILKIENKKEPGTVFLTEKKELAITCGQNLLILEEVQLEGKKIMLAQEFLNGHPKIINSILK